MDGEANNVDQNVDDTVIRAVINGDEVVIDKRNDSLILTDECRRILFNIKKMEGGPADFTSTSADLTQPSFLSKDEKVIFFKMKMFYLLQERTTYLARPRDQKGEQKDPNKDQSKDKSKEMTIAEAYPMFLSPFGEPTAAEEISVRMKKRRRRRKREEAAGEPEAGAEVAEVKKVAKGKLKGHEAIVKTGLARFSDNIRKADQTVFRMYEEKLMKTSEGKGYCALFPPDTSKTEMEVCMFPDYNLLMNDGKDEESKLNNLVVHVRNRLKIFEKMQTFYENSKEDNIANVFTVGNSDFTEMRSDLIELKPKRWQNLDAKKISRLYDIYKDDYASAKTTLIADGTQPITLNRKSAERIKKYVEEYAEMKNLVVPYTREVNFMLMTVPWQKQEKREDEKMKKSDDTSADNFE